MVANRCARCRHDAGAQKRPGHSGLPGWFIVWTAVVFSGTCTALAQPEGMLEPVRPGVPGSQPFWNIHARRFIFPPAFDVEATPGARRYVFTLHCAADSCTRSFVAARPWEPLTPIWAGVPPGILALTIEAVVEEDTVEIFERTFIKSPPFEGTVLPPAYSYRESARRCLAALFRQEKLQAWRTRAVPLVSYPKYAYPAKMIGAVIEGMALYASIATDSADREGAVAIAESAATFLRSISYPPGSPLAGWPPTFWEGIDHDIHPISPDEVLTTEPARAGMAYLELWKRTGLRLHLEAAQAIGATYLRTQLPSGSWYQRVRVEDGSPKGENILVPTLVIQFLDRLEQLAPNAVYGQAADRAFAWIQEHPLKTYNWEAQFEDTRPRKRYRNLSHREPVQFAALVYRRGVRDPGILQEAHEALRFAEDSFVVWSMDDAVATAALFKPGSRWNGNDPYFGSDWFVPAALEQYVFYTPISSASAGFIDAYVAGYQATGEVRMLEKARALASTLTRAQQYWGGGEIPTHLRKVMPELNWLNVSVWSAKSLLGLAEVDSLEDGTER